MFDEVCKCVAMKMMTERYGKKSGISVFAQTEQINRLRYFAHQLDEWLDKEEQHQPHYLAMLFDPARLHRLADSLTEKDA